MPVSLLILYCALILAASLAGGWLPIFLRLTHRRLEMALSFVAGVILGVGMLHLLPHGYLELGSIDAAVRWVLFGFLAMFFVERFFSFHHHGPPDEAGHDDHDHDHHGHAHAAAGPPPLPHETDSAASHHTVLVGGRFSWIGAAIGLTLHGVIEGVALAAAVMADRLEDPAVAFAGVSTFLAIVLHKPFDSLTILTLMSASRATTGRRHLVNALYAAVVPVGVAVYCLAAARAGGQSERAVGPLAVLRGRHVSVHRHQRPVARAAIPPARSLQAFAGLAAGHRPGRLVGLGRRAGARSHAAAHASGAHPDDHGDAHDHH